MCDKLRLTWRLCSICVWVLAVLGSLCCASLSSRPSARPEAVSPSAAVLGYVGSWPPRPCGPRLSAFGAFGPALAFRRVWSSVWGLVPSPIMAQCAEGVRPRSNSDLQGAYTSKVTVKHKKNIYNMALGESLCIVS